MNDMQAQKVLIIDDSITNVVLLNAILNDNGFYTQSASNVGEAFRILKTYVPDIILLDLQMPGLTGLDFLEKFRNSNLGHVPVIIVSAYCQNEQLEKAMVLGAVDYIEKPIDLDLFFHKINEKLNYAYH